MKKKFLVVAALTICLAIVASGTLAYFTAEDTAHNVITSGGVNIKVIEKTQNKDGVLVDFPEEGMKCIMPGSDISKIVSVENTGKNDAWIRVRVVSTIQSENGADLPLVIQESGPVMTYIPTSEWILGEDGYYYYEHPVAVGNTTDILFDTVSFSMKMGNEYQNCTANILIYAQAVQTANNGETVLEAQGWPTEK